ncbi:hypothetical protein AVEN_274337-1 [Araneus ventricosus]|uniref:Uncharacterized protein n=1 Tax=Araneus ventricosus TaxID=182803 RepID=A0A4Y2TVF3_ARAVE|nr:hypothetical protein AVEN_274337-1 [Araneus ventricosus]
MGRKWLPRETPLLLVRSFVRRVVSNVILTSLRQYPVEPIVNEIMSLAKIRRLEVDSNDIDELVEERNQELTTGELIELHCVLQQEVMENLKTIN